MPPAPPTPLDRLVVCNPADLPAIQAFMAAMPDYYRPDRIYTTTRVDAGAYWIWSAVPVPGTTHPIAPWNADLELELESKDGLDIHDVLNLIRDTPRRTHRMIALYYLAVALVAGKVIADLDTFTATSPRRVDLGAFLLIGIIALTLAVAVADVTPNPAPAVMPCFQLCDWAVL